MGTTGPIFEWNGRHPALDFVNTLDERLSAAPAERLSSYLALTSFARQAGLIGLDRALDEYRVLLLDQRGTGHSTPVNRQTLPLRGGPAEQADHLMHFRADSIVRDCEAIRPTPSSPCVQEKLSTTSSSDSVVRT